MVYLCALPFIFFAGLGVIILFLANSYLLGRQYFEFAAMRFRPPHEAKAMRKANAPYIFLAGMAIALFVSIPVVNLATPIFAMAYMVHIHKRMSGHAPRELLDARSPKPVHISALRRVPVLFQIGDQRRARNGNRPARGSRPPCSGGRCRAALRRRGRRAGCRRR